MPLLTSKGKRSFTYSVIILFILGIFALGYIFYFIPHNRKTIHKNGFLILKTISSNIANEVDSHVANYTNWVNNSDGSIDSIQSIFETKGVEAVEIKTGVPKDSNFNKLRITVDKVIVSIKAKDKKDVIQISQSIDQFFTPLLKPLFDFRNAELFAFYALQKTNGNTSKIVYQDEELALRSDVADSLLPKGGGSYVAGIRDMTSQNIDMKMFYYPFAIDNSSFVLSGFVETDKYVQAIKKIPFYFVYPLVIIFLLLLILFPVIKFYIMDTNEPLRAKDVIFFGVSAILSASLLTILIIQFLLWKGEEKRVERNLETISAEIQNAFNAELRKIYRETEIIDQFKTELLHSLDNAELTKKIDISDSVRSFLKRSNENRSTYLHLDRISWIDSTGDQTIKAELYGAPVFTNVSTRNYVTVFRTGTPYRLPGDPDKKFGWEPIYSWTNNEFNISVSLQSRDMIVAMAAKMYSLVNTILPSGYGFCIVDEEGNALVHSDGTRNLRENFLEKTDKPSELKGAIASRQSKIIDYVVAYSRLHMMHVRPLDNSLPFYLISFYDEGYIAPINIRILIFTLLLCTLFFIISAILWWVLDGKGSSSHALVFCKMDFLDWITPKSREVNYYFHAFIYTIIYLLSILAIVLVNRHYKISNFNILAIIILTPLNIILLLYCMRFAFNTANKKRNIFKTAIAHLIITIMFFFLAKTTYPLTGGFLIFQLAINAFMWIYGLIPKNSSLLSLQSPFTFLKGYKLLITMLVICLAVLPASIFTWYAHNQELIQTVKRQQLYLAGEIRERNFLIQQQKQIGDSLLPDPYFDSLRLSYGIYKIHNDKIDDSCKGNDNKKGTGFESFYFDVAEKLSTPYYKQQSYAALQDEALDTGWHWTIEDNTMHFWYQPTIPRRRLNQTAAAAGCLHIASAMPDRFVYLTKEKIFPIALITLLLLIGLYNWLAKNAEQIFLTRYIYSRKNEEDNRPKEHFAAFFDKWPLSENDRLYTPVRYKEYSAHCDPNKLLEYEKELVDDLKNGKELYNYVWNSCTEKEKFLLYGFAVDGTINYKNSKEIIELMNKGILVVDDERMRIFSPGFRAFILNSVDEKEIAVLQKEHRQNSTWQYIRVPLLILLIGIAALIFFTQQGVFDKILVLAGGVSTLIGLATRFFTPNGASKKA
ncbi:MAG TPA: hypothetical protein VGQ09_22750 [Chitinophagaceae bacterium]|jgi:hypothetical protein|nr:hypothetical protein [Chitinophagaceae bacterium]